VRTSSSGVCLVVITEGGYLSDAMVGLWRGSSLVGSVSRTQCDGEPNFSVMKRRTYLLLSCADWPRTACGRDLSLFHHVYVEFLLVSIVFGIDRVSCS